MFAEVFGGCFIDRLLIQPCGSLAWNTTRGIF
jgi:hypothetical protein